MISTRRPLFRFAGGPQRISLRYNIFGSAPYWDASESKNDRICNL